MEKLVLDNGLRVLLLPIDGALSASVGVWIAAGSRFEEPQKQGISHFVEHMMFKGTSRRTARQISEEMDLLGGSLNAYTTKEYTRYYAQTLAENAEKAMDLILDMITGSRMAEEETQRERGVILEEIAMYEDVGEDLAHEALCAAVWPDSPLGRPICGVKDTVAAITPEDLHDYVQGNYTPERMVVVAAGGIDPDRLMEEIGGVLGTRPRGRIVPQPDAPPFTPAVALRTKEFEQVSLELATAGLPAGDERRYAVMLLNFIVGGGASSRLFQRLREELGLAYSIYSSHYASAGAGMFAISAGVSPANQQRALSEIRRVLDGLAGGVTEEEFLRAKAQVKASYIMGMETVASRATYIGRNELIEGRAVEPEEVLAQMDRLCPDDIGRLAEQLLAGPWALSAAGPVLDREAYTAYL